MSNELTEFQRSGKLSQDNIRKEILVENAECLEVVGGSLRNADDYLFLTNS